jgi:hypothetical protein
MATEIRIDNTGDGTCWLYGKNEMWKDYVCENFDDFVVVKGNRDYSEIAEAKWWKDAREIIDDLDCNGTMDIDVDDMVRYYDYPKETIEKVIKAYDDCRYSDDLDFVIEVVRLIHPEREIETATIRGYAQGEWQEVAYVKGKIHIETLENYYFGKIADVTVNTDDDEYGDIITHDELWEMKRKGLKEELRKRYELPEDEEIVILQCDGYKQVADWKEV